MATLPLHPLSTNSIPKVSLQEISLSYKTSSGQRLLALDHIDLKVNPGEFVCIVGPSGCGKSTLLHLIAGLQPPTSGCVLVDDNRVEGPGTDRILIFQDLGLFPWLKVGENVEFGMKMKGMSKAERREKTESFDFAEYDLHPRVGGQHKPDEQAKARDGDRKKVSSGHVLSEYEVGGFDEFARVQRIQQHRGKNINIGFVEHVLAESRYFDGLEVPSQELSPAKRGVHLYTEWLPGRVEKDDLLVIRLRVVGCPRTVVSHGQALQVVSDGVFLHGAAKPT